MANATVEPSAPVGGCGQGPARGRPGLREGVVGLLVALAVCGGLRAALLASDAHVISKDGVYYVHTANALRTAPADTLRRSYVHPGYPWAVALAGETLGAGAVGLPAVARPEGIDPMSFRQAVARPDRWVLAGGAVALLAALAATAGLWFVVGQAVNWRVAWVTALVFSAGDNWAQLGADVLTDSMGVATQLWLAGLALLTVRALPKAGRRVWLLAAATGLAAGLSYWVRPEGPLMLAPAMVLWLGPWFRRPMPLRRGVGATLLAGLAALAVVLPAMWLMGGLSSKLYVLRKVLALGPMAPWGLLAVTPALSLSQSGAKVLAKLADAAQPVLATLAVAWAVVALLGRRLGRPWALLPGPARDAAALVGLYAALLVPLVAVRGMVDGVSSRYLMTLGALLAGLAGALLVALAASLARRVPRLGAIGATALLAGAVAAGLSAHALKPRGKVHLKRAGAHLAALAEPGARVLADDARILFYSGLPGTDLDHAIALAHLQGDAPDKPLTEWLARSEADYLALTSDTLEARYPELGTPEGPARAGLAEVAWFPEPDDDDDGVRVYRVAGP